MSVPPLVGPDGDLSDAEVRRHVHQLIHPDVAIAGQRRLKNSRVLVVGADEIGAPALALLAEAGVGLLGIVDGSPSQVWDAYPPRGGTTGSASPAPSRASAWASALAVSHPEVLTAAHEFRLDADGAATLVDGYDLVLCANEDPALCYLVDDVCALLGKPFMWGGLDRAIGRASVFWEQHGPTYRDLYPAPPTPYFRGMHGVLQALGNWVAATLVMEVIKLITGRGESMLGRVLEYDALHGTSKVVLFSKDSGAVRPAELVDSEPYFGLLSPQAAKAAGESTISVAELKQLLDSQVPLCLVDVREREEYEVVHLPGSVLMPQREFLEGDGATRLPTDRKIVLYCRMGIRSAEALAVLKAHNHPDAVHVGGGILAWADQFDPNMPRY